MHHKTCVTLSVLDITVLGIEFRYMLNVIIHKLITFTCMELIIGIKTVAERRGDDLVINGGKMWTTNAFQADWMCCLANTSKEGPVHQNKSLICVPMDTKGE